MNRSRLESADLILELEESDPSWATLWLVEPHRRVRLGCEAPAQIRRKLGAALAAVGEELAGPDVPAGVPRHVISLFESHHSVYVEACEHGVVVIVQDAEAALVRNAHLAIDEARSWIEQLSGRPRAPR